MYLEEICFVGAPRGLLAASSISCPALPCPALPCPALSYPALPCPALPCRALPCPALRCAAQFCPAQFCPRKQSCAVQGSGAAERCRPGRSGPGGQTAPGSRQVTRRRRSHDGLRATSWLFAVGDGRSVVCRLSVFCHVMVVVNMLGGAKFQSETHRPVRFSKSHRGGGGGV